MKGSLDSNKILFPSRRPAENGLEAFKVAKCRGFEGVVAKDLSPLQIAVTCRLHGGHSVAHDPRLKEFYHSSI